MTTERELAVAIYVLYLIDCAHWLKQGQASATRCMNGTWKIRECREESYTLLGHKPVMVNPIDFRPAYIELGSNPLPSADSSIQEFMLENLPDVRLLTSLAVFGALNILFVLPVLLLTGFFEAFWHLSITVAAFTQIGLLFEVFWLSASWRITDRVGFWREYIPLLLNPVAALRSGDFLLRGLSYLWARRDPGSMTKRPKAR